MPVNYIKKLSSDGKGSIASLESKWDKAKTLAKEQGHEGDFAYVTGIFKKMIGENYSLETKYRL